MKPEPVTLADGREALLVESGGGLATIISKPERPAVEHEHSYAAVVGSKRSTWKARERWPPVPAGTWAYRAYLDEGGYVTGPWLPIAGGPGRMPEDVLEELSQ